MRVSSVSHVVLASVMLNGAQATFEFNKEHCTEEQTQIISSTMTNVETVLDSVTSNEFTKDSDWYKTFFGNTEAADSGFSSIKQKYGIIQRILKGDTDKVVFRCSPPDNTRDCREGVSAYVPLKEDASGNSITICPQFFDEKFHRPAFKDNKLDCDMSGTKAAWKTREQTLIHEMMHLGVSATAEGKGQWKASDRIIDCVYGVFLSSKLQNYNHGFEVAKTNADNYAFTAMYNYFSKECSANKPKLITYSNVDPATKIAAARCYLGSPKSSALAVYTLTEYTKKVADAFQDEIDQSDSESEGENDDEDDDNVLDWAKDKADKLKDKLKDKLHL